MIYVVRESINTDDYFNKKVTSNIQEVFKEFDKYIQSCYTGISIEMWLEEGVHFRTYTTSVKDKDKLEKDFIMFITETARMYGTEQVAAWAENILKTYDSENPTINSLIYSLYMQSSKRKQT